jgi:hypothetical protein
MIAWVMAKLGMVVVHVLEPWDGYVPPVWNWWPA